MQSQLLCHSLQPATRTGSLSSTTKMLSRHSKRPRTLSRRLQDLWLLSHCHWPYCLIVFWFYCLMNISFAGIFLEGLLSFLSPCVLPLLPLFMAYLSGEGEKDDEGNIIYDQRKTFLSTIFFVLGISFVFVLLGLSVGFISDFLKDYLRVRAMFYF